MSAAQAADALKIVAQPLMRPNRRCKALAAASEAMRQEAVRILAWRDSTVLAGELARCAASEQVKAATARQQLEDQSRPARKRHAPFQNRTFCPCLSTLDLLDGGFGLCIAGAWRPNWPPPTSSPCLFEVIDAP